MSTDVKWVAHVPAPVSSQHRVGQLPATLPAPSVGRLDKVGVRERNRYGASLHRAKHRVGGTEFVSAYDLMRREPGLGQFDPLVLVQVHHHGRAASYLAHQVSVSRPVSTPARWAANTSPHLAGGQWSARSTTLRRGSAVLTSVVDMARCSSAGIPNGRGRTCKAGMGQRVRVTLVDAIRSRCRDNSIYRSPGKRHQALSGRLAARARCPLRGICGRRSSPARTATSSSFRAPALLAAEWETSVAMVTRAMQMLAAEGLVISSDRSSRVVNYPGDERRARQETEARRSS